MIERKRIPLEKHTPGKITFRANGDANSYALMDEAGNWWLSLLLNGEQITTRQEANLRRLAACWNAFEGVSTEMVEQYSVPIARQLKDARADLAAAHALLAEIPSYLLGLGQQRADLAERIRALLKGAP